MSVKLSHFDICHYFLYKVVAESAHFFAVCNNITSGNLHRLTEPNNSGYIACTCAQAKLLFAAIHKRSNYHAVVDIESAHSFGTIQFVPAKTHSVDTHFVHIYVYRAYCLRCISVEDNILFFGNV